MKHIIRCHLRNLHELLFQQVLNTDNDTTPDLISSRQWDLPSREIATQTFGEGNHNTRLDLEDMKLLFGSTKVTGQGPPFLGCLAQRKSSCTTIVEGSVFPCSFVISAFWKERKSYIKQALQIVLFS